MTKADFEARLDKAASGDLSAMRAITIMCYDLAKGGMEHGDIQGAQEFMTLGNGWKDISEGGFTDFGNELDQIKDVTRKMFNPCW